MIKFTEQSVSLLETIDKDLKLVLNRTNKKKLWSRFILNLEVLYNKYVKKSPMVELSEFLVNPGSDVVLKTISNLHLTEKKNGR
jgi:hypothetical protein|tara:strand:- start:1329 stop:1580 length:252 start_codon:yes stop_codon:yes gene_type:complete